ncbi:MAG TPA: hypothetical protein VFW20_05820 [Candidatus Limnocylindrales bacterium]|nr:hypothetical protein [Candidatus Limnocylindrales bacterium]
MTLLREPRRAAGLGLALGIGAVVLAAIGAGGSDVLQSIAAPPAIVRAGLVAFATVAGLALLAAAVRRLEATRSIGPDGELSGATLAVALRGIRFVFLAVAAFAAAAGWLIAHPLPIVVGLIIAGVDVAETSLLLLVAARREP